MYACLQTALDLAAAGFQTYVAVDAVGARNSVDLETALRRMESAGVILTTTETAMFEWCRTSEAPEFKRISALAKEQPAELKYRCSDGPQILRRLAQFVACVSLGVR